MAIKSLSKLPKRKVTMDEILGTEDINHILDFIDKRKGDMEGLLVIWTDKNGVGFRASGMTQSQTVWNLNIVKAIIIENALREGNV